MATLMEKLKEFTREREQSPENVEQDDEDYVYPGDDEEDEPDSVDDKNFEYEFDNDEQSEEEPTEDDDYVYPGDEEEDPESGDLENSDSSDIESDQEEEDIVDVATENPSMQGLIRNVPGAKLISKRKQPDDTYTELWMYTVTDVKKGIGVRNEILSGTDIPIHRTTSDDEIQSYSSWSTGNIEMIEIKGIEQ